MKFLVLPGVWKTQVLTSFIRSCSGHITRLGSGKLVSMCWALLSNEECVCMAMHKNYFK